MAVDRCGGSYRDLVWGIDMAIDTNETKERFTRAFMGILLEHILKESNYECAVDSAYNELMQGDADTIVIYVPITFDKGTVKLLRSILK